MYHHPFRLPTIKLLLVLLPVALTTANLSPAAPSSHIRKAARALTTPLLSACQHPAGPSAAPRAQHMPSEQPSLAITPRAGHLAQAAAAIGAPPELPHHRLLANPGVRHFVRQNFMARRTIAPSAEPAPALQDEAPYDPAAGARGSEPLRSSRLTGTRTMPRLSLSLKDELAKAVEKRQKPQQTDPAAQRAASYAEHVYTPLRHEVTYDPAAGARGGEPLHATGHIDAETMPQPPLPFAAELVEKAQKHQKQSARASQLAEFFDACNNGDADRVRSFIAQADETILNATDTNGRNALHLACTRGHAEIVSLLLDSPCISTKTIIARRWDMISLSRWGSGPNGLHLACKHGHIEVARRLIGHPRFSPEDVNALDHNGASALYLACRGGHDAIAQLLLDSKVLTPDTLSASQCHDGNILHLLCNDGRTDLLVKVLNLLSSAPWPRRYCTALNNFNLTPFEHACRHANPETVQALLDHPSYPNEAINRLNAELQSPLTQAIKNRWRFRREVIDLLITHPHMRTETLNAPSDNPTKTALFKAAYRYVDPTILNMLLRCPRISRAPLNARDEQDRTALHLTPHASIAKVLLDHPDFTDGSVRATTRLTGDTALHTACQHRDLEKVALLMRYTRRSNDIKEAEDFVRNSEHLKFMVNAHNHEGYTPLHATIAAASLDRQPRYTTAMICNHLLYAAPEEEEDDVEASPHRRRSGEGKVRRARQSRTAEGEEHDLSGEDDRASATDEEDGANVNPFAFADVNARIRRNAGAGR